MGRYIGPVCRLCRREGSQLFLKGERCFKDKCAIKRRNYAPGQHGRRRIKLQGYGIQLREKQKVKRIYGVLERQFRLYFKRAAAKKGVTGEILLSFLERRLDNVVYRLGFASSRAQARQLVNHGHFLVNGHKVDIPSYSVRVGDVISPRRAEKDGSLVKDNLEISRGRTVPGWLQVQEDPPAVTVVALPTRDQVGLEVEEQLVVEFCSR
jgi:small subunit ribosomal protein S4